MNENGLTMSEGLPELLQEIRTLNNNVQESNRIMSESVSLHEKQIETLITNDADKEVRLKVLEIKAAKEEGREEAEEKQRKFMENNWHKFLLVFVAAIPVLYGLYSLAMQFVPKGATP